MPLISKPNPGAGSPTPGSDGFTLVNLPEKDKRFKAATNTPATPLGRALEIYSLVALADAQESYDKVTEGFPV